MELRRAYMYVHVEREIERELGRGVEESKSKVRNAICFWFCDFLTCELFRKKQKFRERLSENI